MTTRAAALLQNSVVVVPGAGQLKIAPADTNKFPDTLVSCRVGLRKTSLSDKPTLAFGQRLCKELKEHPDAFDVLDPIERGIVKHWNFLEAIICHEFEHTFRFNKEKYVILGAPVQWSKWDYERMTQMAFERLKVSGFVIVPEPLLACYGFGVVTSVVVDIGWSKTDFTPVVDSNVHIAAVRTLDVGLRDVYHKIIQWLNAHEAEIPKTAFSAEELAMSILNSGKLFADRRFDAQRQPTDEIINPSDVEPRYTLPEGTFLDLSSIQSTCVEALFMSDDRWGSRFMETMALCEPDKAVAMMQTIILTGGGSYLFHGIRQRVSDEINAVLPITENYNTEIMTTDIQFVTFPDYFEPYKERTDLGSLLGGAITAKLIFSNTRDHVTVSDYNRYGPSVCHTKA